MNCISLIPCKWYYTYKSYNHRFRSWRGVITANVKIFKHMLVYFLVKETYRTTISRAARKLHRRNLIHSRSSNHN